MRVETFSFDPRRGWSAGAFPKLDSPSTLVTVFGARSYAGDHAAVDDLLAAYPEARIIGCSTAGEILGTSILDGSLTVGLARFDNTELRTAVAAVPEMSASRAAGEEIARMLTAPDLRGLLVISDGVSVNGSDLLRGINSVVPPSVVVTGGLAGDGANFKETWVIADRALSARNVAAVGFYGERVKIGHGSKGGWDIFGPERLVSRSAGNVLFELDGRPALALYKQYLGERAAGLPSTALLFPLCLRDPADPDKVLVRTILSIDEATQSMTFAGDIPQGCRVQLMRANFDRLIDGASEAARLTTARAADGGHSLAIAVSCVGRRLVLGERAEEEIEAAHEALPAGAALVGFYSYGEISPYATGRCDLHNQTMTITDLAEV